MQNIWQLVLHNWPQQRMHMIWHDDITAQPISFAIEMTQRTLNNLCHRRFFQHARPAAPVQLFIQDVEAQLVQLIYLLPRVRFGMTAEPILSLVSQTADHGLW